MATVTGIFLVNWTEEEILAVQTRAKVLLTEGKTVMDYAIGGRSTSKQFTLPIDRVLDEVNYALRKLWPDEYNTTVVRRRAFARFGGTGV